jgi:hypothetical protein
MIGGALGGGLAGAAAGFFLPPGPLTGAAAGAAGDLTGQELANYFNNQSFTNVNWGQAAGAALGGAAGGGLGQVLNGLAGAAGLEGSAAFDWGNDILGGNLGFTGGLLGGELDKWARHNSGCSIAARKC